ncbi:glycosyltransferase family 2 protein [Larkinella soli]|uniref:glycosyltransferase family 2 protein n=1 Tax=Larkinella soli TaxID=1770527 RepID=UPI000FFCA2C4|nr:glycosyltransferase family 2 protein [Larkinella soli]
MKVSVCIITYNQVNFIGEAIESVVSQKTNFPFEILIGDDFSKDGTRELITDYANRYPDLIRPVLHPHNMGQNGLFNTLATYRLAKGEFIAAMDGDDYWTDPLKLQKQVDFLQAHPDFSTCFHNALITWEDGSPSQELNPPDQKAVCTIEDLIGEDEIWFMATSSVMFRNVIKEYPDWFKKSMSGDIPRYVLLAKYGKIGYLPDVMSVYRKNRNGSSFADREDDARFLKNRIEMYKGINQELNYQFDPLLKKNIARYYKKMLHSQQYRNSYYPKNLMALKYLRLGSPGRQETREILRDHVVPPVLGRVYSALAIGIYRLRKSLNP